MAPLRATKKTIEILLEIKGGIGNKTGVIVDKCNQIGFSGLSFYLQFRTTHHIGLPDIVGKFGLESPSVCFGCFCYQITTLFEETINSGKTE
jgi:hypothetical protein